MPRTRSSGSGSTAAGGDTVTKNDNSAAMTGYGAPLAVEGPYENDTTWFLHGLTPATTQPFLISAVDVLFRRCRVNTHVNTRYTLSLLTTDRSGSTSASTLLEERLVWEAEPRAIASSIIVEVAKLGSTCSGVTVRLVLVWADTTRQLTMESLAASSNVTIIEEDSGISLVYAFYYAALRNALDRNSLMDRDARGMCRQVLESIRQSTGGAFTEGLRALLLKDNVYLKDGGVDDVDGGEKGNWTFDDIPELEMKLAVRCVVFRLDGYCMYDGSREHKNEIMLLFEAGRFHYLRSRKLFRKGKGKLPKGTEVVQIDSGTEVVQIELD